MLLFVTPLVFLIVSCGDTGNAGRVWQKADVVPSRTLQRGALPATGTGSAPTGRLLCGPSETRQLLAEWKLYLPPARLGSVDFAESCVIATLADDRPSTGYRLRAPRVVLHDRRAIVSATVYRPAGIIDGMSVSRPYVLLVLDRAVVAPAEGGVVVHLRER